MLRLTNPLESLERLRKNVAAVQWAKCPSCDNDWTKLYPCPYSQFDATLDGGFSKREGLTHLCIECAETVKGLPWCADQWPAQLPFGWPQNWLKLTTFWPDHAKRYDNVTALDPQSGNHYSEHMWRWSIFEAKLQAWRGLQSGKPAVEYHITSGGPSKITVRKPYDKDFAIHFDTAISAWHWLRTKAHTEAKEVPALPAAGKRFQRV